MRELTTKQKQLIKKWYNEKEPSKEEKMLFYAINPIKSMIDLTLKQIEQLEKINNTEVLPIAIKDYIQKLRTQ